MGEIPTLVVVVELLRHGSFSNTLQTTNLFILHEVLAEHLFQDQCIAPINDLHPCLKKHMN